MAMDFGMFYEIMVPKPWISPSERDVYKQVLAQVVQAERSGFSHFWTVEHHFLEEFSHCSAPGVLYGAVAALTKTIRIGHGVRLSPFPYNHPVRAAEAAATLDLICDGRLEFGTGRSGTRIELEGFGIDPKQARAMWEEAIDVIVGCWTNETFSWEGKYFKVPPRGVIPKPLQKPHPALWGACSGEESHEVTGAKGLGLLSFSLLVPLEGVAKRIQIYKNAVKHAKPAGKFVNDRVAAFTLVHCAETDGQARKEAEKSFMWYLNKSLDIYADLAKWQLGKSLGTYDYVREFLKFDPSNITFDYLDSNDLVIVGSPETCIRKVQAYRDVGIDQLLCLMQNIYIPHSQTMNSIKLWGENVIPHFK